MPVSVQLATYQLGIQSFDDSNHSFEFQFLEFRVALNAALDLVGRRQQKEIGDGHAVDSCNKGHRDSVPDFLDVCEILHHLNQAHHSANDADGRRVAARAFEDLGFLLRTRLADFHLELHHAADLLYVGAIHAQSERFPQERILDFHGLAFEGNQSILARLGGVANQFLDGRIGRLRLVQKHLNEPQHRALQHQ